jgi:hypothetical protein
MGFSETRANTGKVGYVTSLLELFGVELFIRIEYRVIPSYDDRTSEDRQNEMFQDDLLGSLLTGKAIVRALRATMIIVATRMMSQKVLAISKH